MQALSVLIDNVYFLLLLLFFCSNGRLIFIRRINQLMLQLNVNLVYAESGLFGVSLDVLLEHDQKKFPHLKVPLILKEVMNCGFQESFGTVSRIPEKCLKSS